MAGEPITTIRTALANLAREVEEIDYVTEWFETPEPRRLSACSITFDGFTQTVESTQDYLNEWFYTYHLFTKARRKTRRAEQEMDLVVAALLARLRGNPTLGGACDFVRAETGIPPDVNREASPDQYEFAISVVATTSEE